MKPLDWWIVCVCGHTFNEHAGGYDVEGEPAPWGVGYCHIPKCECERFARRE